MKIKSLFLGSFVMITPIVTLIACGQSEQESKTFVVSSSESLSLQPYDLDYSTAMTMTPKAQDYKANLGAGKMLRIETIGSAQYNENGTEVVKSAYTKYKMDLISEIQLTDAQGNKTVFNSDEVDQPGAQTQNPYVALTSSNTNSVNHASFKEKLSSTRKMTFKVKSGVKWIDNKGEQTKYDLKAADFVYSYLRSYYNGFFQRVFANDGGSAMADAAINAEFKLDTHFRRDRLFTKNQLFDVYGVSSPKFRDLANSVNADNNEVSFDAMEGVSPDFNTFFEQYIVRSNIIAAAPSEYIKEQYNAKYKVDFDAFVKATNDMTEEAIYTKYKKGIDEALAKEEEKTADDLAKSPKKTKADLVADQRNKIIQEYKYGTGLVLQTGVYWYGLSGWENNLYVGPYYPSKVSGNSLTFNANQHFADQEWAKSKTKVEVFVIEYGGGSAQNNFDKFKQGSLSEINFNSLDANQKKELLDNRDKYVFKYLKPLNTTHSITKSAILNNPAPRPSALNPDDANKDVGYDYSFNDAFAKMMYGRDKATLKKADNYGVSKTLYKSYGLSFKTIITAALNWEHIAKQSTGDENAISWTAQLSPDVNMGGSDQTSSTKKTPREYHETINTLFAVNKDGEKIVDSEVKPSQNLAAINKSDVVASYKSASFAVLKAAMAELLSQMALDTELELSSDFTLEWEIANTGVLDEKNKVVYQNIVKTLQELSPKVKPIFKELKTTNEIKKYYEGFQNFYRRSGVENDFDGVGSWLDKQGHDTALSPWALYKIYSEKSPTDSKNPFPEFTKMAIELKRQADTGEFKLPEAGKFEKWDSLLSELESQIYLDKKLLNNNTVAKTTGVGGMAYQWSWAKKEFTIDNIIEFGKFGKKYQESKTNEELVQLIKEFNILKGISINTDSRIFANDKVDIVFYQKGIEVPLSKTAIVYANDIKLEK